MIKTGNEDILASLNQMLIHLINGEIDQAVARFDQTEPLLLDYAQCHDFASNCRNLLSLYREGTTFLHALANGNLSVSPPEDPTHKNYVVALYKQLHANLCHLSWQAEQIAKGDLKQKVNFLGDFSVAFNKMIEALREKELMEEKIRLQNELSLKLIAEKDKFFSIVAHDLRGPLGGFMVLAEMMADDSQEFTPEQRKDLALTLSQSSRNIYNLLENLLEWSRMQRGHTIFEPQVLTLKELVSESVYVLTESTRNKPIDIVIEIPPDLNVFADKNMLQSVIRNLVSNAIKFTNKGGQVIISACQYGNDQVAISVKDTGIGMTKEMVSELFKLDTRCNRPGTDGEPSTGLGLLLCNEFVVKHGGTIWVESEPNKGSTFFFTIPLFALQKEKLKTSTVAINTTGEIFV